MIVVFYLDIHHDIVYDVDCVVVVVVAAVVHDDDDHSNPVVAVVVDVVVAVYNTVNHFDDNVAVDDVDAVTDAVVD